MDHHEECRIVVPSYALALTIISCSFSVLGTILIIVTFIQLPEIRNFSRKLLLALTVADCFTAFGYIMGSARYIYLKSHPDDGCKKLQRSDSVCVAQSFVTTFSSMTSFFLTTVIAVHIYLQIARRSHGFRGNCAMFACNVLSWGAPGVITIIAASTGALGSDNSVGTGSWCWIKSGLEDTVQITWMVVSGKGWEILCYLLTAGLYVLSKVSLWTQRRQNQRQRFQLEEVEDMRNEDENFIYVPLVLYLLRIWGTVRFFMAVAQKRVNNVHIDRTQAVLLVFQSIGDSGQAFCNCILFCFCDTTVRRYLFHKLCPSGRQSPTDSTEEERQPLNVQS